MSSTPAQQQPADPRDTDSLASASSLRLLLRARRGDRSAREALIARYFPWLRRWARGRLPDWARAGVDTSDLVQDALLQTFRRIAYFEPQRDGALRAYLRLAVDNRIRDEMRRVARRPRVDPSETTDLVVDGGPTPLEQFITDETWARYLQGLQRLTPRERRLIVGRAEMGYSYKQLALIDGRGQSRRGAHGVATGAAAPQRGNAGFLKAPAARNRGRHRAQPHFAYLNATHVGAPGARPRPASPAPGAVARVAGAPAPVPVPVRPRP